MLEAINEDLKTWNYNRQIVGDIQIPQLLQQIKDGYYKTKECKLNLEIYDLSSTYFECPNLFEFIIHYKLVENCDIKYPIIINKLGQVIDGRHRLVKAIMLGLKEIDAIQILDSVVVENKED